MSFGNPRRWTTGSIAQRTTQQWTYRESHPNFRFARPASSYWTISPKSISESHRNLVDLQPSGSRGTRTHKRVAPATCFQDRALIQPDDFRINEQISAPKGRVGLEPTHGHSTSACSAAELPLPSRVLCGNRTRVSRVEAWRLCRSAKSTCRLNKNMHETIEKRDPIPDLLCKHQVGLEPTLPRYGCGVFAAKRPVP